MPTHRKPRKLVPHAALAAMLCMPAAAAGAVGGSALAGSRAPQAVMLTGTSGASGTSGRPAAGSVRARGAARSGIGTPCVTSADFGSCGPYHYPQVSASRGAGTTVNQDVWRPIAGASQTLTVYNPGDWSVSVDMPAGNGAVVSYPDVKQLYTTASNTLDPLSNFSSITSSFAETGPGNGGGDDYEAAYDIWAGTGSGDAAQEIMIWVDDEGQIPAGSRVGTADILGTSYTIWSAGDHPVSLVRNANEASGTINILAALHWLESNGYMPADSGLNQIDFGWEICSTGGTAKKFSLTAYRIESS